MLFIHSLTNLSLTSIGTGLTVAGLCALAFMPAAGILIDRFGGRRVLIGVLALRAIGFAALPVRRLLPRLPGDRFGGRCGDVGLIAQPARAHR